MKNITVNKKEIDKFSKLASEWWNPNGKFKPLHKFNPVRLSYIKESILKKFKKKIFNNSLKNLRILDIGCGGGLLCEPLSRLGAKVVGIDASEKNIKIAKTHAKESNLKISYYCASPENFVHREKFDVILNMEIVEHVQDINLFLKESSKFLKKNGIMFIATLNKTLKSYIFAIVGAEYILNLLPKGTHEYEKFIKPSELTTMMENNGLVVKELTGMSYNPLTKNYWLGKNVDVNYLIHAKKI